MVDSSNHVTDSWGSFNAHALDALASGAMILSSSRVGMEELFGEALKKSGLALPLFDSSNELTSQLNFYLSNDNIRERTAQVMRDIVLSKHTYSSRALQLVELLENKFSMRFTKRSPEATVSEMPNNVVSTVLLKEGEDTMSRRLLPESKDRPIKTPTFMPTRPRFRRNNKSTESLPEDIHSLCVGIRTAHLQSEWLPVLIRSMIVQHQKSAYKKSLALQFFVVDTEANTEYTKFLIELADEYNDRHQFPYVQVVVGVQTAVDNSKPIGVYGYDDTDRLLNVMLSMKQCLTRGSNAKPTHHGSAGQSNSSRFQHSTAFLIPSCEWMMFTNGDNMYNSAWFDTIAPLAIAQTPVVDNSNVTHYEDNYDIVGWDFITHHPRGPKNDTPHQSITIAIERKFLDLGSVIVRSSLFTRSNTKFLQEAALTKDLFARDYFTVQQLLPFTQPQKVKLIHQNLLLHQ